MIVHNRSNLGIELEKSLTLEDGLDCVSNDNLLYFFNSLCEYRQKYPEIETGGSVWINLESLCDGVSYATLKEVISGEYFIKPDAVQTSLFSKGD